MHVCFYPILNIETPKFPCAKFVFSVNPSDFV